MGAIDVRPQVVDISAYACDTLSFTVNVSDGFADGKEWHGEIRAVRGQAVADAEFTITPQTGGAVVSLSAAQTRALAEAGVVVQSAPPSRYGATPQAAAVVRYTGEWDVQISQGGADPVTTLAQGSITIDMDVTDPTP